MAHTERPLTTDPTFWGLLVTQFLGAFNDNVFKFLVMFLCTDRAKANPLDDWQGYALIAFASPFVLFSGVCGYLADRYSKTRIIVLSKLLEIAIMGVGLLVFWLTEPSQFQLQLLIGVLFLMGSHSAFFGPSKYGILPELYAKNRLPGINGIFLMTTFLAIIGGAAAAGALKDWLPNLMWFQGMCVLIAIVGTLTALPIRRLPPAQPNLRFNPSAMFLDPETRATLRLQPKLWTALIYSSVFWFVGGVFQPSVNAIGKLQYGLSDTAIGQLSATTAIGIAMGSVLAGMLSRARFRAGLVRVAAVGMMICLGALAIPGERIPAREKAQAVPPVSTSVAPPQAAGNDKLPPVKVASGNWAEKMLSERKYDFGTVAHGSKVEHVIEVKNIYREQVTLGPVESNCDRCFVPSFDKQVLNSNEVARLTLKIDTTKVSHLRAETVSFDATWNGGHPKTVRIPVKALISDTYILDPSTLEIEAASLPTDAPVLSTDFPNASPPKSAATNPLSSQPSLRLPFASLTGAGLLLMGAGLFAGLFAIPLQVYLQAMSPTHLKGRMIGAMNLINWIGIVISGAFYAISNQVLIRVGASPNAIFGAIAVVILIAAIRFPMQDESLDAVKAADA